MRVGLWSCLPQLTGTCARWDELHMRLQHLALFRGIGLGACAVNLGSRMPSTRLLDRLWRHPSDHHRVTVMIGRMTPRSEEHTSELQSRFDLVCRLLLEKKKL